MTADEAIEMLGRLGARPQYAHYQMDLEGAVRSWVRDLGDLPAREVDTAVDFLVRTQDGFPTVHRIRRRVAVVRGLLRPAPDLAWSQLMGAAGAAGLDPMVWRTADTLGGVRHCQSNPETRFAFRGAYTALYEQRTADVLAADGLTPTAAVAEIGGPPVAEVEWRVDAPGLVMHLAPAGCGAHHQSVTDPCEVPA